MPISIKKHLLFPLCLTLLIACESQPTTTDQPVSSPAPEATEEPGEEPAAAPVFIEIDGVPLREEHHALIVRVTEDFEASLHREPSADSPVIGSFELSTEAVLGEAGLSDGLANLPFERSRMLIPGHPLEAAAPFDLAGASIAEGQTYYFVPLYEGEGTFSYYFSVDGQVIEAYAPPEVALGGLSFDELRALGQALLADEAAQWWVHITLSADEMGWFRLDRPETTRSLEELPEW